MDVLEAIRTRRSVGKVKADVLERILIEQILEAATWAPNHYHTEPWKFFVLSGDGRKRLGRVLGEIAKETMDDANTAEGQQKIVKEEQKAFRAPTIIVAAVTPPQNHPRAIPAEDSAAVHAAIQNMLLAAHALGLGAIWRTGKAAYHPKMKELFDLGEQDHIAGFIYIGYPDIAPHKGLRSPAQEKTVWLESDAK